jgi:hypothetical protein
VLSLLRNDAMGAGVNGSMLDMSLSELFVLAGEPSKLASLCPSLNFWCRILRFCSMLW